VRTIAVLVLVAALPACGPKFDHLEISAENLTPDEAQVTGEPLVIPPGNAIAVTVEPESRTSKDYDDDTDVALASEDPAVLDVLVGALDREFVLVGVAEGETCMEVEVDGDRVDCIAVEVRTPE